MKWELDWERNNKYKQIRLMYALSQSSLPLTYTQMVLATTKLNPCEYLVNLAKCKRKRFDIAYGLTKDSFLHLMKCSYFQVEDWQIELNKPGEVAFGWCFMIKGYYLIT